MPIPDKYRLATHDPSVVDHLMRLCDLIEDSPFGEADSLLAEWHQHAQRKTEHGDFKTYWGAIDKRDFVLAALHPEPHFDDGATYADVLAILNELTSATLEAHESDYFYNWIDAQFPACDIMNLVYWPDHWFDDPSLVRNDDGTFKQETELSNDQIIAYAIACSGRAFSDAPELPQLPFPLPSRCSKNG